MEKTTKQLYEEMANMMAEVSPYVNKFDKGVKNAGVKVRKAMQNIKNLAQQIRLTVSEEKAAMMAEKENA